MKKLFLSSFIIITSFFFVNSASALTKSLDYKYLSNLLNSNVKDINSNISDNDISLINNKINELKNDNYYIVFSESNRFVIYYYSKSYAHNKTNLEYLNMNFQYYESTSLYVSLFINVYDTSYDSSYFINKCVLNFGSFSFSTNSERNVDYHIFDYYYSNSSYADSYNNKLRIYSYNLKGIKFHSYVNNTRYFQKIDTLLLDDNNVCLVGKELTDNTLIYTSNFEYNPSLLPMIEPTFDHIDISYNTDNFNNKISVDLSFNITNDYSNEYSLVYQYVSVNEDLSDEWIPCINLNPLSNHYSFNYNYNGTFYLAYIDSSDVVHGLGTALVNQIINVDMISIDITNTEGIVLIPKTDSSRYSSNIYFSAPDEFINQYQSNENFYFKYSNRSLHLANVNNFDINDLYSQEKLINNFSPGDSLTEIIDKNNYNISLFRAEKPDYIVSNDRPMIISFDRNVYNYQVLGENGSDNDNTTIIDPNTGKPILVDSFKETDFFTLMKHAFSRFKSVIRNIFKLVSTFFYSLPSTLNYYFVLVMFFIVLLLFLKFLI